MYLSVNITISYFFYLKVWSPECFWNLVDFGFKKMMEKYRMTSEGCGMKNAQNDQTIINTIYMQPNFSIIKKIVRKLECKCTFIVINGT